MTRAWKISVHQKLKHNEDNNIHPGTVPELADMFRQKGGADKKAGFYRMLDPDGDQVSSAYVDAICKILRIDPPFQNGAIDEDLEHDLDVFRSLAPDERKKLVDIARHMPKRDQ